jgi:hypothetical protein
MGSLAILICMERKFDERLQSRMNHANGEVPLTQVCAEGKRETVLDCLSSSTKSKIPYGYLERQERLHMVAYLCELGYDLMIAPGANISKSPGFETPRRVL